MPVFDVALRFGRSGFGCTVGEAVADGLAVEQPGLVQWRVCEPSAAIFQSDITCFLAGVRISPHTEQCIGVVQSVTVRIVVHNGNFIPLIVSVIIDDISYLVC